MLDQYPRMRSRTVIDILATGIPYAHSLKCKKAARLRQNRNTNAIAHSKPDCVVTIITPTPQSTKDIKQIKAGHKTDQSMMAHQSFGFLTGMQEKPDKYGKSMHAHDRISRRHSTDAMPISNDDAKMKERAQMKERAVARSKSSRGVESSSSYAGLSADSRHTRSSSRNRDHLSTKQRKSVRSVVTPAFSDMSDDSPGGHDALADDQKEQSEVLKVRNRALIHENRRLQELVSEFERRFGLKEGDLNGTGTTHTETMKDISQSTGDDDDGDGEESVTKLKGKIRALKTKRKHEKLNLLQMEKNVKAHASEIESLQRELHRTVTELEKAERARQEDKHKISMLSKQLAEVDQLKADLQKRDNELGVTLVLLQSKTECIIQLEHDVEVGKEKLHKAERRIEDMITCSGDRFDANASSFRSMELISAEAEIKSLRRQNMMLKLVVEELQEARQRRSDSDIDVDSIYLKLPLEGQQEIPLSVGLGALSLAEVEGDESVDTDMLSFDTNDVVVATPERTQKDRLPTRPIR